MTTGPKPRPLEERFYSRIDYDGLVPTLRPDLGACHLWTASRDSDGYGMFRAGSLTDGSRRLEKAHRLAWELEHGAIPDGLTVDHLCFVRHCVRTSHMELVPQAVNTLRAQVGRDPQSGRLTSTAHSLQGAAQSLS